MEKHSKIIGAFLLLAIIIAGIPVVSHGQELMGEDISVVRISGDNRVETSIELSKKAYPGEVDTLFLAGYQGDADALTASFMAGQMKGPLLLANKEKISSKLFTEIKRLNPKEIIILGGENAVSEKIVDELKKAKYPTRRIQGRSRIETAVNLASDYYMDQELDQVFLVEYDSLVDALAIGPVAAKTGIPVLITEKNRVPKEVKEFLERMDVKKVTIVGGESTVSKKGREELLKLVDKVERVSGRDRIETSLNIAKKYFTNPSSSFLANGWKNADALIGGYFAAMEDAPIILIKQNAFKNSVSDYLSKGIKKAYILGGEAVLNEYIYDIVDWTLRGKSGVKPQPKPKPHVNYKLLPAGMPKEAKVTQINSIERSHEYNYFKKLPGGGFIDRLTMTYFKDVGEPICIMYGEDNNKDFFMVKMRPNNSQLSFSIFFNYPVFGSDDYKVIREEMKMFFRIYGYE